jgi:ubiquinone/menaquinone biosynthesis C-methylase UbiE
MKEEKKADQIREELFINSAGSDDLIYDQKLNLSGSSNSMPFNAVHEGDTVLSLGSGIGMDLLIIAGKAGPSGKVIGMDMTDEIILSTEKNAAGTDLENVEIRKGIMEEIPVESGTVDWVIANCFINLSPEKEGVFRELYRVLKPGGQILVSDVVAEDLPEWMKESSSLYCGCIAGAINEQDYIRGLKETGLNKVEVRASSEYGIQDIRTFIRDSAEIPLQVFEEFEMDRDKVADHYAEILSGKIFSLQFYAIKPEKV